MSTLMDSETVGEFNFLLHVYVLTIVQFCREQVFLKSSILLRIRKYKETICEGKRVSVHTPSG